jgi:hypothetical protein
MKIKKDLDKGEWTKWKKGVELLIRRYPLSKYVENSSSAIEVIVKDMYNYCLLDWKGITWDDGTPVEVNDTNKLYLYDYLSGIVGVVRENVEKQIAELKDDEKN